MIACAEGGGGGGGAATLWAGALSVVAALPPSLSGVSVPCDSGRPYYADPNPHVAAPTHVQHQVSSHLPTFYFWSFKYFSCMYFLKKKKKIVWCNFIIIFKNLNYPSYQS